MGAGPSTRAALPGCDPSGRLGVECTHTYRSHRLLAYHPPAARAAAATAPAADRVDLDRFLADTGVKLEPSGPEALYRAGRAWSDYLRRRPAPLACPRCGAAQEVRCDQCGASVQPRQHVVADFVIGAHAVVHANSLLTRDRGYFATYFPGLRLS